MRTAAHSTGEWPVASKSLRPRVVGYPTLRRGKRAREARYGWDTATSGSEVVRTSQCRSQAHRKREEAHMKKR